MYALKEKKEFIVIEGSDIINGEEAQDICERTAEILKNSRQDDKLLIDIREVNLEESKFDIFINYLSRINLDKIALVLDELISSLKFKLWRRKYKNQVIIEQFSNLEQAKKWLTK